MSKFGIRRYNSMDGYLDKEKGIIKTKTEKKALAVDLSS
jgi:hypothetical protein